MRTIILTLATLFLSSCALFQPSHNDLFYTEYETNPDYTTRKIGSYFVVLTFKPKTIYNNYSVEDNETKFIWRIGDNEIIIEQDELSINKIKFGNVEGSRIIKITEGKVYIDNKYRRGVK